MPGARPIRLDASNVDVTFAVRWFGALTVRGRFTRVVGTLRIPDGCLEGADLTVDVLSDSVRTGIALRDRHPSGPQFLDAGRHRTSPFAACRVSRPNGLLLVTGALVLRGTSMK